MDVLENGPSSIYARFFDINWHPVKHELKDKILVPFLGDQYGEVLENQELRLGFKDGGFFVTYWDYTFPLRPDSYITVLTYRIKELEDELAPDDPAYIELLSINTALVHLPPYTETAPENMAERNREKEIAKKRLAESLQGKPGDKPLHRRERRGLQRHQGRAGELRSSRRAARQPGVQAFLLAGRNRGDQLPEVLRRQRPGGHPGGGPGRSFDGDAQTRFQADEGRQGYRAAGGPPRRPLRPLRLLPPPPAQLLCPDPPAR